MSGGNGKKRTIDERLDALVERHEALTQSVELIAAMQQKTEKEQIIVLSGEHDRPMKRGELVLVTAAGNKRLNRVIWEDVGAGFLICTEEAYRKATETGSEPVCVGFPATDVVRRPPTRETRK